MKPRQTPTRFTPEQVEARRQSVSAISYPEDLPVSGRREEIARAIAAHQVVIVCGETGSGKTTQLPKLCLELGRGIHGMVGHTQPRRIAARATAARVAEELKVEPGGLVGYKIRFTDRSGPRTLIKLMTDGILLAETQGDPLLSQYDTLIIDEAHERSLNIDFLLGFLRQLLVKRPELKLIITSATIDAGRFAKHFADAQGQDAPVIEVSGRLYPVDIRYKPVERGEGGGEPDLYEAIGDAVDDLARHGAGDVLVFLPGEREIREAAEALRKHHQNSARKEPREILPLFGRLSVEEQQRVFAPHAQRRIVLATNVAETSLTVPGIRYVVDPGLARVKRYSYRNKVEQLQVERVSQAAARQRAGRCGRVQAGICIRLMKEDEFNALPAYTEPELLRSSLAAVVLRMKSIGLGEVESFPFIDPPPARAIADGYALLAELGAVDEQRELTNTGRQLARLPVDPRVGRMLYAAHQEGCLAELLVIAAGLSVQDPRDRPMERAQAADAAQKPFDDERSDFLSWIKLWNAWGEVQAHETNRKAQRWCQDRFLSYNRMREWRDIHSQLRELAGELGWKVPDKPSVDLVKLYAPIHRALLSGLLGNIGMKSEEGHYLGARGIRFWVHPGSGVGRKAGRWIMAAELVETSRLYARCVATIEQQWLEQVGAHLLKRSQSEPHWEKKAAQVVASERGTLYGLLVYANRRVHYGPMDPEESRRIFIREALVDGDWECRAPFFAHNRRLVRDIENLEHKSRRPDVLVDDELIFAFYDSLIPEGMHNGASFEAWRKEAEAANPKLLYLKREDLMRHEAAGITTAQFPPHMAMAGRDFALEYQHDPGGARDGVTMTVPLVALNQVSPAVCDWLVPGLRREKITQLCKTLPQKLRHRLGVLPEFADAFLAAQAGREPGTTLTEALRRFALAEINLQIPPDGFRPEALPVHLAMNFRVVDEHGRQLGMGRNLAQLRAELGEAAGKQFAKLASLVPAKQFEPEAGAASAAAAGRATVGSANAGGKPTADAADDDEIVTDWTFGELAEIMELRHHGQTLIGYPAVTDRQAGVALQVFDSEDRAREAHRAGLLRLYMLQLKEQARFVERSLPDFTALALQFGAFGDAADLRAQLLEASFSRSCLQSPLPRDAAAFAARRDEARSRVSLIAQELARLVAAILAEHAVLAKKLRDAGKAFPEASRDIQEQLSRLLGKRWVADTPFERLTHLARYIRAAWMRLDKLRTEGAAGAARDARAMAELGVLQVPWMRALAAARKAGEVDPRLLQFGWLLEELRVQLFAQALRTPVPVSSKRLAKMWQDMQR